MSDYGFMREGRKRGSEAIYAISRGTSIGTRSEIALALCISFLSPALTRSIPEMSQFYMDVSLLRCIFVMEISISGIGPTKTGGKKREGRKRGSEAIYAISRGTSIGTRIRASAAIRIPKIYAVFGASDRLCLIMDSFKPTILYIGCNMVGLNESIIRHSLSDAPNTA
jgi:hypothetical protein